MTPLIDQFPKKKLSREEEAKLAARIQRGDEDATNALVMANMREALIYTRKTSNGSVSDADRVSLCYRRLMRAAKRFDPKRGTFFAFSKAALRGLMKTFWEDQGAVRNAKEIVSLDQPDIKNGTPSSAPEEDEGYGFVFNHRERVTGEITHPDFESIFARDQWEEIQKLVAHKLNSRQRMVLALVYKGGLNCPEIGKLIGVTRSRVHAIHREAIKIIRDTLAANNRLLSRA